VGGRILGAGQPGFGPTVVALQQKGGFTNSVLGNQIWSVTGWGPNEVNSTFIQPFLSYATKFLTPFGVNPETRYNWRMEEATLPMNWTMQQLVKIGKLPVAFQLGYRHYVEKPNGGPDWGLRFATAFLFPKK
jgi:hypothetical protein